MVFILTPIIYGIPKPNYIEIQPRYIEYNIHIYICIKYVYVYMYMHMYIMHM